MRNLLLGSIALLGLLLTGGCEASKYVNTTLYGEDQKPHLHHDPMNMPDVPQNLRTSVAVGDLPLRVQASFQNDYPNATVTSVEPISTGYGSTLYKVSFIEDGIPNTVIYRGNGIPRDEPRERIEVGRQEPALRTAPPRAAPAPAAPASSGPF